VPHSSTVPLVEVARGGIIESIHNGVEWFLEDRVAVTSKYGPELPLFNLAGRHAGEVRPAPVFAPSGA
jgi:hypothetical protein